MKTFALLIILCSLIGCGWSTDITNEMDLDPYVGQRVMVRGTVSNTYVPYVGQVDAPELHDHRGEDVEISGVLRATDVTAEDIQRHNEAGIQHRGVGRFYDLDDMTYRVLDEDNPPTKSFFW